MAHTIILSDNDHRALTALLSSGITHGALERLGLSWLQEQMSERYNGPWEYDTDKEKRKTITDYRLKGVIEQL